MENIKIELEENFEMNKYAAVIAEDILELNSLLNALNSWDELITKAKEFNFQTWPIDKKNVSELKDKARDIRKKVKETIEKKQLEKYFLSCSEEINEDMETMYKVLKSLQKVILLFSEKYTNKKREKNIIDFQDIEHGALNILIKTDEQGNLIKTEIAKNYMDKFEEIAIDEYQDSNLIQEYILTSISKGNNIFMVGDVKQSIYKFRQARPDLFLDKYEKYSLEKQENADLKIQLFHNFRSKKSILDITNLIFQNIMSKELGEIEYHEGEYLNFPENAEQEKTITKSELHIIDLYEEENEEIQEGEQQEENTERIENIVLEAKFVANRIKELLQSEDKIYDKKKGVYRKIECKDITILLRATTNNSPIYEKEISDLGFPVFSDTSKEYLDSVEVQTILSILKIIDNPDNDIALVTVLKSYIGDFSDNDLVKIRLCERQASFYKALLKAEEYEDERLKQKIIDFLKRIQKWREKSEFTPLNELIWEIYLETGYYHYVGLMPGGILRQANLKMLFQRAGEYEKVSFKGLFHFIKFIDKLKMSSGDLSAAKIIGENDNVIRIMSIHKSKGLEFPIVFLCNFGKKFNMKDLNKDLLLHQDLGFGIQYINCTKKVEYSIPEKEAIKIQMKKEILSEEMRILYVALTRAREKLIITGVSRNLEDEISKKEEQIKLYSNKAEKIDSYLVSHYHSYLDWLQLVILNSKEKLEKVMDIFYHKKENIMNCILEENANKIVENKFLQEAEKREILITEKENIKEMLEWEYPYKKSTSVSIKTSVSKLKETSNYKKEMKPKFMLDSLALSASEKGTLIHLCLQKLDFKKEYSNEIIEQLIRSLVENRMITKTQSEAIEIDKILQFTKTNIAKRLKNAREYYKEMPFYMNISAKEIYGEEIEEEILLQGIIDLYFIDENGKVVLLDYKTDRIKEEQELIERYKEQLKLYKKALEKSLKKGVHEVYIYSTYLEKEIRIFI